MYLRKTAKVCNIMTEVCVCVCVYVCVCVCMCVCVCVLGWWGLIEGLFLRVTNSLLVFVTLKNNPGVHILCFAVFCILLECFAVRCSALHIDKSKDLCFFAKERLE